MNAGRTILMTDLQRADILVSTATGGTSAFIRAGGLSKLSHAKLYLDGGTVIESIGQGVVIRPLETSIAEDTLTIVLRHKRIDKAKADIIINQAKNLEGKKYDHLGVALAAPALTKGVVILLAPILALGALTVGAAQNIISPDSRLFCSEVVASLYEKAGIRIVDDLSYKISPDRVYRSSNLKYVGNLIGSEA